MRCPAWRRREHESGLETNDTPGPSSMATSNGYSHIRSWHIWLIIGGGSLLSVAVITLASFNRHSGTPAGEHIVLFWAQGTSLGQYETPPNPRAYGAYVTALNPSGQPLWVHGERGKPTHIVQLAVAGEWQTRWSSSVQANLTDGAAPWFAMRPEEQITWLVPIDENATGVKLGVLVRRQHGGNESAEWVMSEPFRLVRDGDLLFIATEKDRHNP